MHLSVVIPVYNEQENIRPLVEAISHALDNRTYEIIFVDDGSVDGTIEAINQMAQERSSPTIKLIQFSRNFGQTSALAAGIEAAQGAYIATLDGDLQNDPADIPMMIDKLEADGLDILAGRRVNRQDGMVLRKIPSKVANALIRKLTNVQIQDYGCTLKVFRNEYAKKLDLYGELHRFIPILGNMHGAKIGEVDVRHHPRRFGTSKYGIGRTFKVASDLLLMYFFLKYRQKPMHLFGTLGMVMLLSGGMIEAYLLVQKILGHDIADRPLFYVGILLLMMAVQFITTGFVAELVMRTYYSAQNRKPYTIRHVFENGKKLEQVL
ncbi:MAG: glycosyl transferase, family 2 [Rickettsiales bacterium]|nr:glycosyl transferase, family 2 [Rickettsiales bacterium]